MTAQPTLAPDDEHAYVLGYVAAIQAAASAARLILPASVLAVADDAGTIPALAPLKAICARHNRTVRLHPQFIQAPTVAQCFGHRGIADLIQARPPADDASRSLIAYAMTADLVITRGGKAGTVLIAERMAGDATRSPWVAMTERNAAVFFLGCTYTVQRLSPKRRVMQTVKIDLFRGWLAGRLGTRQTTDGYVSNPCQRAIVDGRPHTVVPQPRDADTAPLGIQARVELSPMGAGAADDR